MAQILIYEPRADARRRLEWMVLHLGHEPVATNAPTPEQLTSADVFLVEPAAPIGAVLAQAAHLIDSTLPIVSVSDAAPPPDLERLGVEFAAALVQPFTLEQLAATLEPALRAHVRIAQSNHNDRTA